jgi:hypothetical protein
MNIFEGKSPEERNKLIIAIVLGVLAIGSLGYTFKGMFFPAKKNPVASNSSPTPTPNVPNASQNPNMPSQQEMDFEYSSTPVIYNPGNFNAPDPGRNIFAFYEPGKPTPFSPTPTPPPPTPKTPTPTPTPPIYVAFATPQSIYAGSKGFRMDVSGDKFTPDSVILFNGSQIPTTYMSPQNIYAQVSDGLISFPGTRNISVITPGGKYSNMISLNVQEPPKPLFKYIGLISRKRYNNDTAYFEEQGKELPFGARLNDVVSGRFRLKSISSEEVVFEDVSLGFKHKLALNRPSPGTTAGTTTINPRGNNGFPTYDPSNPNIVRQGDCPAGIPCNIPRYVPTPIPQNQQQDDVDDNDGETKP